MARVMGRGIVRARRGSAATVLAVGLLVALPNPALAHPLGNFTTNTLAEIVVGPDAVSIRYVLDLAEIPTLQEVQRHDLDPDAAEESSATYRDTTCADVAAGLDLRVDGRATGLEVTSAHLSFPPGQAGLTTLRLECGLTAATGALAAGTGLSLHDANHAERLGWREITAVGDRMTLTDSDVPERSISDRLRDYPEELLQSPLAVREARVTVAPGGTGPSPLGGPDALGGPLDVAQRAALALTDLVAARELTLGFALLAIATASGLGALHALAPGHGKTVMAAFLIGRNGATRQALGLGLTVAVTHTAGVLALGALLSTSQVLAPERVFGWLGAVSGLIFAAVGAVLLRSALRQRREGGHGHAHGHVHGPEHTHGHGHTHGPGHGRPVDSAPAGWKGLIAPGLAGGLVPSPSALVVLLGGLALGRAWFGVSLVIAYGIGMAATLVGLGFLLVRARGGLTRFTAARPTRSRLVALTRDLPVAMAGLIVVGGLIIVTRFAMNPGA